jgi:integrase
MAQLKFTSTRVSKLTFDPTGPKTQIHWDSGFGNRSGGSFGVRCFASGKRSWVMRALVLGRQRFFVLGDVAQVSLDAAYAIARDKLTDLDRHQMDPKTGRHITADEGLTVSRLLETYLERSEALGKSKQYLADCRAKFALHVLPKVGGLPAIELTKRQVLDLHSAITTTDKIVNKRKIGGRYCANHTVRALRAAFNHAIDARMLPKGHENPASLKSKELNHEQARTTFLSRNAVPQFMQALEPEPLPTQAFFVCALVSGMRKSELLGLKWSDVDLTDGIAHLGKTKNGEQRAVALPNAITQRLRLLPRVSLWTFSLHPHKPRNNVSKAWKRIIARAGLPGLHLHDLRRTFATWAATSGVSLAVTAGQLGHRDQSTTLKVYAQVEQQAKRAAAEQVAALLEPAVVVGLPR